MISSRLQALTGLKSGSLRLSRQFAGRCSRHQSWRIGACRWSSSDSFNVPSEADKTYYVTTPIFYVNAAPHVGHLYTMVLSDALKRWQQVKGKEAFLSTGTDEHGMKIQQAAMREGVEPKQLCDENSAKFLKLTAAGNISHDTFIRTTDLAHKDAVEEFWKSMKNDLPKSLGLYKGEHKGWYSVSDECFYPGDLVESSIVPQTGKKIKVSTETGSEVTWVEEETWFFPLAKYRDQLLKFYDENPNWIQPAHRMKEVRAWVENHLEDLSVTRPSDRLKWGIRDPEDSKNTIYVWVDALINYLTVAGYGESWNRKSDDMGMWPADVQVVGKDIIRFHGVYWPALLLALNFPQPKQIICHNHWTMSGRKMSKSVGNVVNPFFAVQRWGTDPLRYFLLRNANLQRDMDYSNEVIHMIYDKELRSNIGNLFYRVARPTSKKRWSTKEAVDRYFKGQYTCKIDERQEEITGWKITHLEKFINEVTPAFSRCMDEYDLSDAIAEIYNLMRETNRFVTTQKHWELHSSRDRDAPTRLHYIIFNCTEALRISSILLQPIIPEKAERLLNELCVRKDRRTIHFCKYGADNDYGVTLDDPQNYKKVPLWETIFPPAIEPSFTDVKIREEMAEMLERPGRVGIERMPDWLALEQRLGEKGIEELKAERRSKIEAADATGRGL